MFCQRGYEVKNTPQVGKFVLKRLDSFYYISARLTDLSSSKLRNLSESDKVGNKLTAKKL